MGHQVRNENKEKRWSKQSQLNVSGTSGLITRLNNNKNYKHLKFFYSEAGMTNGNDASG